MWRLPQAGTLAVLKLPAALLLVTLVLVGFGTLLSAGGLTVLTVHPTRTVSPHPTVTDTTSGPTTSPPTTPPTTPPTSPVTSPPTTPPTSPAPQSAPATPGPASGPLAQGGQEVVANSAALLTSWIGLISQVLGLLTAMIGLAAAGRRPATIEPADRGESEPPEDRRPRHR
ncbi:hypothetical protein [Streptomyces botrytidirepellens]|uniref:hypothetical protein n=1 Tax=Streptomyces botrytidirepellens TaxID=2486417 RepID=UPI0016078C82|nr:hypothetical protein [Streptomyces botrytidirepellens]